MGLFGELDANDVSDDPFYVAPDVYQSVLTEMVLRTSNDGEKVGLSFQWTIEEEESEFAGNSISEWVNVYLNSSMEEAAGAVTVKRDRARLKSRLQQLGMSNEEMNDILDEDGELNEEIVATYIGTVAFVEITESKGKGANEGKVYTNIKKVTLPEDA